MTAPIARVGQQSSTVYTAPPAVCDKKTEEDVLAMVRSGDPKTVLKGLSSPCVPVAEIIKLMGKMDDGLLRDPITRAALDNLKNRKLTEAEALMCIHNDGNVNINRIGIASSSVPLAELVKVLRENRWPYMDNWLTSPALENLVSRNLTTAELTKCFGSDLSAVSEGIEKMKKNDHAGAEAAFTLAISLDPKSASAYVNRGINRMNSGNYKGAISDFNHVLDKIDPENMLVFLYRAIAKYRNGSRVSAVIDALKAAKHDKGGNVISRIVEREARKLNMKEFIDPVPPGMHVTYSDEVEEYFTRRISQEGRKPQLYILRCVARVWKWDVEAAFEDYQSAYSLDPNGTPRFIDSLLAKIDLEPYYTAEQVIWDSFREGSAYRSSSMRKTGHK